MSDLFKKPYSDSPLRKSRVQRKEPVGTPVLVNDDEAERRQSRLLNESALSTSSNASTSTTASDKEGLMNCLQIFNENKINKSNAWGMSLIDNFASLVRKHHKTMDDFQLLGTSLMASSKIYGLRVDSVHTEVVNMSNVLSRRKVTNTNDDESAEPGSSSNDPDQSMSNDSAAAPKTTQRRAKRKTGARCFIAKNKATLNAKLDTFPISDPTFVKLNSTIGELSSSHRMVNYLLPSVDSEIQHCMVQPFWDSSVNRPLTMEATDEYEASRVPGTWSGTFGVCTKTVLRPEFRAYKINHTGVKFVFGDESNTPDIEPTMTDLAFDINAEIEPIPQDDDYMETGFDVNDLDELDEREITALRQVKNLHRPGTVMEDMRPVDSSSALLEYSYRPMDNIMKFWAGPSYWKINRPRVSVMATSTVAVTANVASNRNRKVARKRFEPIQFPSDGEIDLSMFISTNSAAAQRLRRVNISKRWDPKSLKLPTNLHLDRNRYDTYYYAPNLRHEWSKEPAHTLDVQTSYNYANAEDREYCSNIHEDDDEDAVSTSVTGGDDLNSDQNATNVVPNNETLAEIGTEFAGAPEQVEKIFLPFAKRAKVVDMKQLKRCCINLITKACDATKEASTLPASHDRSKAVEYTGGAATFKEVYETLPTVLSTDQKVALSRGTAFYSILHLTKENQLDLIQLNEDDFAIRQINMEGADV